MSLDPKSKESPSDESLLLDPDLLSLFGEQLKSIAAIEHTDEPEHTQHAADSTPEVPEPADTTPPEIEDDEEDVHMPLEAFSPTDNVPFSDFDFPEPLDLSKILDDEMDTLPEAAQGVSMDTDDLKSLDVLEHASDDSTTCTQRRAAVCTTNTPLKKMRVHMAKTSRTAVHTTMKKKRTATTTKKRTAVRTTITTMMERTVTAVMSPLSLRVRN